MLVSVIITTKNEEQNIESCLKSIKKQSCPQNNIEIIIVDNNSTDKTKEIARKYTKKVFNKGPERSVQRNFGVSKSRGKYILYLDADMTLSRNVIKEATLVCERKQQIVALYIPEIVVGDSYLAQVRRFERSFYDATVIDCVRFVKKDTFIEVGGFDTTMSGPEDWDFDKKVRSFGEVRLIKSALHHNEGVITLKSYLAKKAYYAESFDKYIKKWGVNDVDVKRQFSIYYRYLGVFIERGKWKKVLLNLHLFISLIFLRICVGLTYLMVKYKINTFNKSMILNKVVRIAYSILGPSLSSRIALNPIIKGIIKIVIKPKGTSIYEGEYGIKLKLTPEEVETSGFMLLGTMNPYETNVIKKVLKEGDVFIDVGAYVDGWHSLVAAKIVGPTGHVYTFEPHPDYYKQLKRNVRLNKLENITTEQYALSSEKRSRSFFASGLTSSFFASNTDENSKKIDVSTLSLDEYIINMRIKTIRLIKIDVEGAELEVLRGMERILNRDNAPDLIVECIDKHLIEAGESKKKLFSYLKKFNYSIFSFSSNGLTQYDAKQPQETFNLYFSRRKDIVS